MRPVFILRLDQAVPLPDGMAVLCAVPDVAAAKKFIEEHGDEKYQYILAKWAGGPFVVERIVRQLSQENQDATPSSDPAA